MLSFLETLNYSYDQINPSCDNPKPFLKKSRGKLGAHIPPINSRLYNKYLSLTSDSVSISTSSPNLESQADSEKPSLKITKAQKRKLAHAGCELKTEVLKHCNDGTNNIFTYPNGDRLIHKVASKTCLVCLDLLLKHNADVNSRGEEGNTPAHVAAMGYEEANINFVEILKTNGADITLKNSSGKTPLEATFSNPNELAEMFSLQQMISRVTNVAVTEDLAKNFQLGPYKKR